MAEEYRAQSLVQAQQAPRSSLVAGIGPLLRVSSLGTWSCSSVYKNAVQLKSVDEYVSKAITVYTVNTVSKPDMENENASLFFKHKG